MKKPKFRRFGISTGTKVQQANLRKLAKKMEKDPGMLMPDCHGQCSKCRFEKVNNKLRKIHSVRSNPKALLKYSASGGQLERGYAAMLILASEDSPIMFAQARLPSGDVSYTQRGKVKKETLIGLQHFDDPVLRLLAYSDMALKRGIHLYSSQKKLLCTGKMPDYPKGLLTEVLGATIYNLRKRQGDYQCDHMAQHEGQSIGVHIRSLDSSVRLCRNCASRKTNIYNEITGRVLAKNTDADFTITLEHDLECQSGEGCSLKQAGIDTATLLSGYRKGAISDRDVLDNYSKLARDSMEMLDKRVFVLGNRCFEDDHMGFIGALDATELERTALERILKAVDTPVIMETATPNAVLSLFWERLGASAIYSVIGDKDLAAKIFRETKDSGTPPAKILRDARIQSQSKNALESLPDLKGLGKYGRYMDDLARAYKAMGKNELVQQMDLDKKETKFKSINCAFLKAMDSLKGKEWHFSKEELDYGDYLKDFALALLDSEPDEYKKNLQNFLTASGLGETVP